jgi:hypothetical protein
MLSQAKGVTISPVKRISGESVVRLNQGFEDRSLSADQFEASLFLSVFVHFTQGDEPLLTLGSKLTRGVWRK